MPNSVSRSVINSINDCLYGVIPSLFCFIVLSKLITNSGIAYIVSKPFGKTFTRLTGLPGIGFSVYLFSFLSGYPSGVIASVELYKNGVLRKEDAERLCGISNNTGPALPVILIGAKMFDNVRLGLTIYVIQLLSSIVACLIFRNKNATIIEDVYSNSYTKSLLTAITESLEGGIKACAIMCGYIIIFNVLGDAISNICHNHSIIKVIRPFIEIVSGCAGATVFSTKSNIVLLSAAVTFGGICVHMQAASVMASFGLSAKYHFFFKFTEALIGFILACVTSFFLQTRLF